LIIVSSLGSFKEVNIVTERAVISFENVSYSADGVHILHDITGFFPKGKITSLVGPSGAGKTTVFKLCNGLESPVTGEIYFNERPLHTYDPIELRRRIGLALQDATMINGTVRENLALPLTLQQKHLSEDSAQKHMELVGLEPNLLIRDVRDLSG